MIHPTMQKLVICHPYYESEASDKYPDAIIEVRKSMPHGEFFEFNCWGKIERFRKEIQDENELYIKEAVASEILTLLTIAQMKTERGTEARKAIEASILSIQQVLGL